MALQVIFKIPYTLYFYKVKIQEQLLKKKMFQSPDTYLGRFNPRQLSNINISKFYRH